VPLIVQVTGREAHLVISRNPLVWSSEMTTSQRCAAAAAGPPSSVCGQTLHVCPPLNDGDRG